jgi:hypothetical protein
MNRILKIGFFSVFVIFIIGFALKGRIPHEEFSSDKWKNWNESEAEWSLRWDMMNSLRNNYELTGMTKDEIIELLGEPESLTQTEFLYYLGMAKKGIDTGTLTIKFNETGKVANYNVRHG